ncbi:DUF935 domain-containing protein [Rhizobium halophytocola]|uniref:Phage gp29-like protein n=1 Tax=Rhizobium halophytocola TaxID=735519 RepID=A0ABS4E421_9HYPH|nr:DUF935 domain-containing protein [Rhizobium halophytocola]MBP1852695.1 phage gp29-like protein [Rhizobium halophytocola]
MAVSSILGPDGRPLRKAELVREQGAPTVRGIRDPFGRHRVPGLTPGRLAGMLRTSIDGDSQAYLELAEDMEERDLHYAGLLSIRKRQVSGLEITVEAASDAKIDVEAADLVREVLDRDEFEDEVVDILDAIGKGFSCTEILWDTSEGQWRPSALKWRDPRWFTFDRVSGETPLIRSEDGEAPLQPWCWIVHRAKVKSGLTIRGGIARAVAWTFLFKHFSLKDWAIFVEAYGQPLRVGKYGQGATEEQKAKLIEAVTSIGSDFAAIIPESMAVEIIQSNVSGNHEIYEKRADWLDRQVSKVVLGQTQTTDAQAGGYAVGKVHDGVRDDIERADAKQLAATLTRDLAMPLVAFNLGPQRRYPKVRIGRPDEVDIDGLVKNVVSLVPLGLKVGMSTLRDKIGLPDPDPDEELLQPSRQSQPDGETEKPEDTKEAVARTLPATVVPDAIDSAIDQMLADDGWELLVEPVIAGLQSELAGARDLGEARAILAKRIADLDVTALADLLARAGFNARLAGETGEDLT